MGEEPTKIDRRTLLKGAAYTAGALTIGGIGARLYRNHVGRDFDPDRTEVLLEKITPELGSEDLPNIVVILVDDLGLGDWGPGGGRGSGLRCRAT